jgi:hypothetical protein
MVGYRSEIHDFFADSPNLPIFATHKIEVKGTEAFPSLFDRPWQ